MKKILFILAFLTIGIVSAQKVGLDVLKFKGNVTSTIRDTYDVPTGEYWMIYNSTTTQLEGAADDDVWSALGGTGDMTKAVYDTNDDGTVDGVDGNSIGTSELQDEAVLNGKIANGTIQTSRLNASNSETAGYVVAIDDLDANQFEYLVPSTLGTDDQTLAEVLTEGNDVGGNKIISSSNGNIDIEPNGTGNVLLGNFTFDADQTVGAGQDNYVLTYDNGAGTIGLEASAGGSSLPVSDATSIVEGSADGTKEVRFEVDGLTTATTRVITVPDKDVDLEDFVDTSISGRTGTEATAIMIQTQAQYDTDGAPASGEVVFISDAKDYAYPQIMCSDLTTDLTTGDTKGYWIAPADGTIESPANDGVSIYLLTAGTTTGISLELDKNGTDITTTAITTDATENDSDDAATDFVLSSYTFNRGDLFEFNFDTVPTGAKGALVTLKVYYD